MEPKGPECYSGIRSIYKLFFPFSLYFIQQLESFKTVFVADRKKLQLQTDGDIAQENLAEQHNRMQDLVAPIVVPFAELFREYLSFDFAFPSFSALSSFFFLKGCRNLELFLEDFLTIKLGNFGVSDIHAEGKQMLKDLMKHKMNIARPIDMFLCWWTYESVLEAAMQLFMFSHETASLNIIF